MKIINMGEYKEDVTDRKLRMMFAQAPLADDGFSEAVVRRLQNAVWCRRLLMLLAIVPGVLVAAGPAIQLLEMSGAYLARFANGIVAAGESLAALQGGVALPLFATLCIAAGIAVRLLEDG